MWHFRPQRAFPLSLELTSTHKARAREQQKKRERGAGERLLNLNTGKIDHNSIELTKRRFFVSLSLLTNIYASKHAACCLHYPACFGVSKYQIADKLQFLMQLAHCCARDFWYFHFYPRPPRPKSTPRIPPVRSFFPFTAWHSIQRERFRLLLCAFDVHCNAESERAMHRWADGANRGKTLNSNRGPSTAFNTF